MTGETIEQKIHGLGRGIAEEAVIVGSNAVRLALPEFRDPHDDDLAVSPEAFEYLRQQPGWALKARGVLTREDGLDVGAGWGGTMDYAGLRARSWQAASGIRVAGLPDVYAYKQRREGPYDAGDRAFIREYLQSPARPLLGAQTIPYEVAAATRWLPEELRDHPLARQAILLAANGIHTVNTIYGHPQIGQANQITGDLERPEFHVPATYHNGFGLEGDARALQQHLAAIGASAHDRLLALATDPYTDAIYGNGRFRNNPEGYDELRSADLLYARALQAGFDQPEAERMRAATLDTAFDEATSSQRGTHAADPLARGIVGVDLQPLAEPDSPERSLDIAIEDGCSARYSEARTLGRVLVEHGKRIYSTAHGLRLIDRYADAKPASAPDGPTVMEAFTLRLIGNAAFQRRHEYPSDWTRDNPAMRKANADFLELIGAQLARREITAVEAGRLAAEHTAVHS